MKFVLPVLQPCTVKPLEGTFITAESANECPQPLVPGSWLISWLRMPAPQRVRQQAGCLTTCVHAGFHDGFEPSQ
jgi:hypothetical protein